MERGHRMVRRVLAGAALVSILVLGGCGNDIDPLVGTWETGGGGEGSDIKRLVVRDDGTVSFASVCTGQAKPEDKAKTYRITLDCGTAKGVGEATVHKDGKTITVKWDDGDVDDFRRKS